jgi:tetratricopeptide (TPR) repeat protein
MSSGAHVLILLVSTAPLGLVRQSLAQAAGGSRPSVQEQQCLASALPLIERRALQDAEAALTGCQRLYPQSAILHNALGIVYEQEGRKVDAINAFEKALTLLPSFTAAQIHLGTLYAGAGKCEAAKRLLIDAAAGASDSGALVASGIGLAECHDLTSSIRVLEKAKQANPQSTAATYNLALAHYQNNEFRIALEVLGSLPADQQNENADVLYLEGKVLQGIGKTGGAANRNTGQDSAALLSRACRLRPQEDYCTQAALELIHRERFIDAASLIEEALRHMAPSVHLLSTLGLARFRLGRYTDAIDAYSKAIELDPSLAAPREGLGFLLYMTGDLARARSVVEEGLRNSASEFYLLYLRALILYRQSPDFRQEALVSISASIKQNPVFAPAYFLRGKIRVDQENAAAALKDFQTAVQIDPKYSLPYYRMARIYSQQGRSSEAAEAARKFSSLGSSREDEVLTGQAKQYLASERN